MPAVSESSTPTVATAAPTVTTTAASAHALRSTTSRNGATDCASSAGPKVRRATHPTTA